MKSSNLHAYSSAIAVILCVGLAAGATGCGSKSNEPAAQPAASAAAGSATPEATYCADQDGYVAADGACYKGTPETCNPSSASLMCIDANAELGMLLKLCSCGTVELTTTAATGTTEPTTTAEPTTPPATTGTATPEQTAYCTNEGGYVAANDVCYKGKPETCSPSSSAMICFDAQPEFGMLIKVCSCNVSPSGGFGGGFGGSFGPGFGSVGGGSFGGGSFGGGF